jgi:hypothetical protein
MPENMSVFVNNDTDIIVQEVDYLRNMAELLAKTNKTTQANYILWRVVNTWVKILDERFEDVRQVGGRGEWKLRTTETVRA